MRDDIEQVVLLTNVAVNVPLALASVSGNFLVLRAVRKMPSLRSPFTLLLCGLALSDLAVGAIVQPFFVANELVDLYVRSEGFQDTFRRSYNTVAFCLCGVSLCTIACVSIDRLIAIQTPLRYSSIVTTHRISRILVAIWTICLFVASSQFWEERLLTVAVAIVVCISLSVSTISHVRMYKIVRRHRIEIDLQQQTVENNVSIISLHKSAFNAFIVFTVLFVCYFPYMVVYVVSSVSDMDNVTVATSLSSTVVFANSALNPIVYCWRLRAIRQAVLRLLRNYVK